MNSYNNVINSRHYNGIGVIKFILAFAVAQFHHYGVLFGGIPFEANPFVMFLRRYAYFVVEFFFVISGFFMMKSIRNAEKKGSIGIVSIMVKKIKKLYPLFFLSSVLAFLVLLTASFFNQSIIPDESNLALSLVLSILCINSGWVSSGASTSINGPTWYISIMLICCLWALIIAKLIKKNSIRLTVYGLIILLGVNLALEWHSFPLLGVSCARGYMSFFVGMLLCALIDSSLMEKFKRIIVSIFVVLFATMVFFAFRGLRLDWITVSLFIAPVILFFFFVPNPIDSKIPERISNKMSELSYSLYLMHAPLIMLTKLIIQCNGLTIDFSRIDVWIVFTTITLLIAIATNSLYIKLFVNKKIKR